MFIVFPLTASAQDNKYAVVWGSKGYKGQQICGDNNARLMAHLLKGYGFNMRVNIGRLEFDELMSDLDWLRENTDENSTVIFFYSGHGTMNGVGKFSHYYLNYLFKDIKGELCMIIECCYSGNACEPLSGENRLVIASTAVNHTGYTTTHGSLFGHFFLNEAIKRDMADLNGDGVSMEEAFYYYHNKNPYLYGTISDNYEGEFIL